MSEEDLFVTLPSGCRICYRVNGENGNGTPILVISGGQTAMTQTTVGLVELLASSPPDHPHCVVTFDSRDTGLSTSFPAPPDGEVPYTLDNMVDDVLGLIAHLKLERVHLVGLSMGGPIAWLTAGRLPEVVRSLALIFTSPVGRIQTAADKLPSPHREGTYLLADAYDIPDDVDDDNGWIDLYTRLALALATQPSTEEEKAEKRRESEVTYRREKKNGTMASKANHSAAGCVRWPREALAMVKAPTVVIHAAKDQFFPLAHAEALRDGVDGATLVVVEDCGHELPMRVRPLIADAILKNAKKGET